MGLLRAVRPWTQWIAGWGFDINKGDPDLSESNVREKIRILIGDPAIEPEIVRTSVWYINQAYVTQYSKGRVCAAATPSIGILRRAAWATTPACKTATTSVGSSPRSQGLGRPKTSG